MISLLLSLGCAPKYPTTPDPKAHQTLSILFEGHIASIGGRKSFLEKNNVLIKGRIRTMDSPITHAFTTIKEAPTSIWTEIKSLDGQKRIRGWNGHIGWNEHGLLHPEETSSFAQSLPFHYPLNYKDHHPQTFRIIQTQFAGRPCIAALTKNHLQEWEEIFFDQNTKLIMGFARWKGNGRKHWFRYGHYTAVEGIKHPLSIEEKYGKQHKVVLIESVQWNVPELSIAPPAGGHR